MKENQKWVVTPNGMFDLNKAVSISANPNVSVSVLFDDGRLGLFDSFSYAVILKNIGDAKLDTADGAVRRFAVNGGAAPEKPEDENPRLASALYLVGDADGYIKICTAQNLVGGVGSSAFGAEPIYIGFDEGYVFNPKLSVRHALNDSPQRL